jgi:hypothetical protein
MTRRATEIAPGVFRFTPPPDLSYEWKDRKRIMERDWARVHTKGDKAPALPFWAAVRRTWTK